MLRLEDLALFVRAAALSSFSDAAREAGLQPAQVSAAIKRLETTLNIRLFARSTRSLRLTPEGEAWLPYATQMLDTLHAGLQKIRTPDDEVRGTLQIAVPSDLGRNLLLRVFRGFRQRHPALRLRILFSDHRTDVFKIRWTWPFATAITTMLRLSPCPSRPITDECWWLRPAG
ncbi:transcriptional regulator [Klebsiella oxytoca]|nr:transcriptional regulator [Klebsiella oxytoca]